MFTENELKMIFVLLDERAEFKLAGKEADSFVALKQRIAQEYNKLMAIGPAPTQAPGNLIESPAEYIPDTPTTPEEPATA